MDLRDYIRIITKRWLLITLCTLAGMAGAVAVTATATPTYQARIQLFVSAQGGAVDASQLAQGNSFTQQRVKSYADVVDSARVTQPVVEQLGLPLTPKELAGKIGASAPVDTVLIDIYVTDESPQLAADIADAVGQQFVRVVGDLEAPPNARQSPVQVSVVEQADVPTVPVSPRPKINLALGILVGLVLGVGLAVLRETLDTSVKTPDDLAELGDVAVLGGIGYDRNTPKHPLVVRVDPHGARAEAFRQLRTNLQFVDVDRHPHSIVVTSSLPEEGKTTTAANLAITMAQSGRRVVLVEGDLRRPRFAEYMGLEGAAGLTNVLIGQAELSDVLQPWGREGNLRVLASGPIPPNPSELVGSHQMLKVLEQLNGMADIVLIDAPPLLPVTDAALLSVLADGALVVCRIGKTRREQMRRAVEALRAVDARVLGIVLNMTPSKGANAYSYGYSYAPTRSTKAARKPPQDKQPAAAGAALVNVPRDRGSAAAAGMSIVVPGSSLPR